MEASRNTGAGRSGPSPARLSVWAVFGAVAVAFVALRVGVAALTYYGAAGREVSSDARFYLYFAAHPAAVWTGENLRGPDHDAAVLTNYGPLLGVVLGLPIKLFQKVLPDFFAVRAALIGWEGLGLLGAFVIARRAGVLGSGATPGRGAPPRPALVFAALAAFLPLGWASTAAWAQDEILLAPFIFSAFILAYRNKPVAAALALHAGAWGAKYFALAFLPAAWLVCRDRRRFLGAALLGGTPLLLYVLYMKKAFGVVPFFGYSAVGVTPFTLSAFSLYDYVRAPFGLPASRAWISATAKVVFSAALVGVTWSCYRARARNAAVGLKDSMRIWLAFAAPVLIFNVMGQPEYLGWFAYLTPLALVALLPARKIWAGGAAVSLLAAAGWLWNVATAVATWAARGGGDARAAFAAAAVSRIRAPAITAVQISTASLYILGLAVVGFYALPKRDAAETRDRTAHTPPSAGAGARRLTLSETP